MSSSNANSSSGPATSVEREELSRRNLLHVIGSAPALAVLSAAPGLAQQANPMHMGHGAMTATPAPAGPYQRKIFNDQQWRTVQVLCDLIIPADEKSGSATQAGVPEFIDDWIDFRRSETGHDELRAQVLGGLTWLDLESTRQFQKPFRDASPDQQKQLLDRIAWPARAAKEDRPWVLFFNEFRALTVTGFFSSKMGVADLPYLGNVAVAQWKGCDPKVWAVVDERLRNGYKSLTGVEVKPGTA